MPTDSMAHVGAEAIMCDDKHGAVTATRAEEFDLWSYTSLFDYMDEHGELLFQKARYEPKAFRARRPTVPKPEPKNRAHWEWSIAYVPRTLYRLPDLLNSTLDERVFVTESEKDVDRLYEIGLIATCAPFGAGHWDESYNRWLHDRDVVIVPHNDQVGWSHADDVARSLHGVATSVRVLVLDMDAVGSDIADWIDERVRDGLAG
jgi:DNA primase